MLYVEVGGGAIFGIVLLVLAVVAAPVVAVLLYKAYRDRQHTGECACHQCRQARHTVDETSASKLDNTTEMSTMTTFSYLYNYGKPFPYGSASVIQQNWYFVYRVTCWHGIMAHKCLLFA